MRASYWGTYNNGESENKEHGYIESIVYPSKEQSLVGSETYARGWGVKE